MVAVDQEAGRPRRRLAPHAGHAPGHAVAGHQPLVKRESAGERLDPIRGQPLERIGLDRHREENAGRTGQRGRGADDRRGVAHEKTGSEQAASG
jgi:hypothetical protein